MAIHAAAIAAAVVMPLVVTDSVPLVAQAGLTYRRVDIALPSPPPAPSRVTPAAARPFGTIDNPAAAPVEPPSEITPESGVTASDVTSDIAGGISTGVAGVGVGTALEPPPPAPPTPTAPVPVGGHITPPSKTRDARPIYPPIAQQARVQGIVIMEATIDVTGRVIDARILRSIPLLDQAAIDAVRQWEFTPTLPNGVPVPVLMTVTMNFTLR